MTMISITYRDSSVGSMSTSHLDGGFIGLGTRVAKEGLVGSRVFAKPVGQGSLGRDQIKVGNVVNSLDLLDDGRIQGIVGVTQGTSSNSTETIQILLSVGGRQPASFARFNSQWVSTANAKSDKVSTQISK